ncbi:MAG: hypothetical protein ACREJC_04260, partial [Tepidisphaeraceae bacterium]
TAATAATHQHGPVRIATISAGADHRNLTLAQDGPALVVRVQTSVTGENGCKPQFLVPHVFDDDSPRRVIVTFSDARLCVYVNSAREQYTTTITPEASVIWRIYPRAIWDFRMDTDEVEVHAWVYRTLAFLGMGAIASATCNLIHRPQRQRRLALALILLSTITALEALLATQSADSLRALNFVVDIAASLAGVAVVGARTGDPIFRAHPKAHVSFRR